ncbi:hypothetical protein D3C72_401210 [compost metagenome]
MAHVVAVEQIGVPAQGMQLALDQVGDGRFTRAGQTGKPQHPWRLALERGVGLAVDVDGLPVHVLRTTQGEVQHAGTDRAIAQAVDNDKAPGIAVVGISIEGDRPVQVQVAYANAVQLQGLGRQVLEAIHIDPVLEVGAAHADGAATDLHQVRAPRQQGLFVHPYQGRFELVGHRRRGVGQGDQVAAADIDLVLEGQGHGLAAQGLLLLPGAAKDAGDLALLARGQHADALADAHAAGHDVAAIATKIQVRPVHPLHRQTERRLALPVLLQRYVFKVGKQARALVPGRVGAGLEHVVAAQRRQRDALDILQADLCGEGAILGFDALEHRLGVVHQVELVDRHHHLADAQQRHQVTVPAGLGQQALAGVDEDHRQVGGGRAGDHVAGVLFVAGGVGDDELALVGGKEAISHIDGDALLALGAQAVDQQGEIQFVTLGAELFRVGFELAKLVLEQYLGFIQQSADQGALAVVDTATGDEAQQLLVLLLLQVGRQVAIACVGDCVHQKYPSCFFFSMEPAESLSIRRPWRSEVRLTSISPMIAGRLSASLSMAPVNG